MPLWSRRNILYSMVLVSYIQVHMYTEPDESPCICYHHDRLSFLCGDWLFSAQCIHQNKVKLYMYSTMVRVDFRLLRRTLKMFSLKTCLFFFFKKSQTSKKYFFFIYSKLQDSKLIHPNVQLHILFSLSFIVLHLQRLFQVRNTFETQIQSNCIVLK